MEVEDAAAQLEALYRGVNGYPLSLAERQREQRSEWSLTYGEVLAAPFHQVLQEAKPLPGETFIDLGSGTGKAVFLAAMLFDFAEVRGIELLADLSQASLDALARYDQQVRPSLSEHKRAQRIAFERGDLLSADLGGVDVVFAHSELFGKDLLLKLGTKLKELKAGARVVSIGSPIPGEHLIVKKTLVCKMDWGPAAATLFLRAP